MNMRTFLLVCAAALLAGCAGQPAQPALFDLGPPRAAAAVGTPALPPLGVAEVAAPPWLDAPLMYFRLAYASEQQPRPYAASRWTMPPAQLFGQRLKAELAQGGAVLSEFDAGGRLPVLRVELDDFTQRFDSANRSEARVALRASLFDGAQLLAQKTFARQVPAPSPDAAGGAKALLDASDALIAELRNWLATLPLRK